MESWFLVFTCPSDPVPNPLPAYRYTLHGWEDGEFVVRDNVLELDRWMTQNADKIELHIDAPDVISSAPPTHESGRSRAKSKRGATGSSGVEKFLAEAISFDVAITQDPHSPHLGGYLWVTSLIVSMYFTSRRHSLVKNRTLVELGAGVGLVSLALSHLGARQVWCTDIADVVTDRISRNVKDMENMRLRVLQWGAEDDMDAICADIHATVSTLDFVVAVDCIYSEASAQALVQTMLRLSQQPSALNHPAPATHSYPSSQQLLSDAQQTTPTILCWTEVRNQAAQDMFLSEAKAVNFEIVVVPTEQWQKYVPYTMRSDYVNFYVLKRAALSSARV